MADYKKAFETIVGMIYELDGNCLILTNRFGVEFEIPLTTDELENIKQCLEECKQDA